MVSKWIILFKVGWLYFYIFFFIFLFNLVARTNKICKSLCSHKLISEKELKYSYKSWEVTFLTKIRKSLSVVPGRPVIFNCVTTTEKVSEYLDDIVKHIMQDSWSCIKRSASDYLKKLKILVKLQRELS